MSKHDYCLKEDTEFRKLREKLKADPNVDWSRLKLRRAMRRQSRMLRILLLAIAVIIVLCVARLCLL